MKYKTYKELAAAYASGELNKETDILNLDNDDCFLYVGATDDDCGTKVFQGNGYADLMEVCEAAGIPCEWV